jgi:hypothetical protein
MKPAAVAFIGNSIAIAGDATLVKAALDRQNTANSIDPNLAAQAQALSTSDDVWVASIAPGSFIYSPGPAGNPSTHQISTLLKNIQSFGGGAKFSDPDLNIAGQAITDTPDNAKALADIARLLRTLMGANTTSDPQAAAVLQLLQPLQITTDGTALDFSLTMPEAQLETFLTTTADDEAAARQKRSRNIRAN